MLPYGISQNKKVEKAKKRILFCLLSILKKQIYLNNIVSLSFLAHENELSDIAIMDCEEMKSLFMTSACDGLVKVWDRRKKGEIAKLSSGKAPVTSLIASSNNNLLAIGNEASTISVSEYYIEFGNPK